MLTNKLRFLANIFFALHDRFTASERIFVRRETDRNSGAPFFRNGVLQRLRK